MDLENLMEAIGLIKSISVSPDADYRFRLVVGAGVFKRLMEVLTKSVDYENFKSTIATIDGQRSKLKAYHEVWEIMHQLEKGDEEKSA
jgi:hypothetical protein